MQLKEKIKDFYCRDDISYQAPGKRDFITIKQAGVKKKIQKRYLLFSLNETFFLFINENPNEKISCSSFKQLRPQNILYKSSTPHNVCICLYHENISLLLKALHLNIQGFNNIELNAFVKLLVCDDMNESCMFGDCDRCQNEFQKQVVDKIIDGTKVITWTLWSTSSSGHLEKVDYTGTVNECVNCLQTRIEHFLSHVFVKRQQAEFFRNTKENVSDKRGLLQVDYSENFSIVEQNEIQSAHWSKKQLSVFTAHLWMQSNTYSMVIVSDDPSHDKWTVSKCMELILTKLKSLEPLLEELVIFSDGAASQFKQRYLLKNMTHIADQFDLQISWNFFATSHGKGNNKIV